LQKLKSNGIEKHKRKTTVGQRRDRGYAMTLSDRRDVSRISGGVGIRKERDPNLGSHKTRQQGKKEADEKGSNRFWKGLGLGNVTARQTKKTGKGGEDKERGGEPLNKKNAPKGVCQLLALIRERVGEFRTENRDKYCVEKTPKGKGGLRKIGTPEEQSRKWWVTKRTGRGGVK